MPVPLRKIAFVIEHFAPNTPGQQLLDRFLMGYPDSGEFHRVQGCAVAAHIIDNPQDPEIERRAKDFGLLRENSIATCVRDADAIAIISRELSGNRELLKKVIMAAPEGARCFIYGALARTLAQADEILRLAQSRKIIISSGTATAVAWRLPDVTLPRGATFRRALIVVQGEYPTAELEGLNGLLPVVEESGDPTIQQMEAFRGPEVWPALNGSFAPLLASAISRSDSPQGDALVDSRTQDLVGLGLVEKLAKAPRCWALRHASALHSMVAVMDGVVADYNVAVETGSGKVWSWQLYRPPSPFEHVYSRLAAALERFFRSGEPPWALRRSLVTAQALEGFAGRWAK
jgi:hypothetical protein